MPFETPETNPENNEEINEAAAAEMLQSEQEFSPEEQDRLVEAVKDPQLSFDVLGADDMNKQRLTRPQMEKLLNQVIADPEVAEMLYITLTESEVDLNKNESWWLEKLEENR